MNPYSDFDSPWFNQFLAWLSTTELRMWFYQAEAIDPLVRFLHVIAASTLFGSILLVDLRLMGIARSMIPKSLAQLAIPCALIGGAVALVSGIVLLLFDPIAVGVHTFFLPKMFLIVIGGANALMFHRLVKLDDVDTKRFARFAGGASIAVWTAVFLCASLNASERVTRAMNFAAPSVHTTGQ